MKKTGSIEHGSDIGNTDWIEAQKRTFQRWANSRLSLYNLQINNLNTDLKSGIILLNLICGLTSRPLPRYNKTANTKYVHLETLNLTFKILQEENIKMVNIGSQDIYDGNNKLILGLLWTLILHYQVGAALKDSNNNKNSNLSQKDSLAQLILEKLKIPEFRGKPKINFVTDWNDGILLSGLVNSSAPNTIPDWLNLNPKEPIENITKALEVAYEYLNIPSLILPEEFCSKDLDEKSVMTLVSSVVVAKPVKPLPSILKKCIPTKTTLKLDCCPNYMKKGIAVNSDFSFLVRASCLTNDHTPPTVIFTNTDTGKVETHIIESIINNLHEVTIHPIISGNYLLEVKSGDESIRIPLLVTASNKNRVLIHEMGKLEPHRPCKVEIDSRYSGLDITSLGISGPSECQLLYSSNGGRKGTVIFLCQMPGEYLITFTTDADKKETVSVPVKVLEPEKLEYIIIGKSPIENAKNTINCRFYLTFYDGKFEKNPVYVTNIEPQDVILTKYGAEESLPISYDLQAENFAMATFSSQETSLYTIESKIKTKNGSYISFAPKALVPQSDIKIYSNTQQKFAIILDTSKKAEVIFTDSNGTSIAPSKEPQIIKIKNKDAALYIFCVNSPGMCNLEIKTDNKKLEYKVLALPTINSIEILGLADLSDNTHVNVPTKIYVNLAKANPLLLKEPNHVAENLRIEIESVKTHKKMAFKPESLGFGLVQIPMIFKDEGEYKLNIFADDILLPQSIINFKVDNKGVQKTITKFYKNPSKIRTHKLVKTFISIPYLPGKDFNVSVSGPVTPQVKVQLLRHDCAVVALYTEEPGIYTIHVMAQDLPNGKADVSVEILPNPEKRVILGRDFIINSPQKLKSKLKFEAFGNKSAQHLFIIPPNAALICTMVDPSGIETNLKNYKITKQGYLTNYINPSTSGIYTLNVKMENDLKKLELHPIFFYVKNTPNFNNVNENSVLINTKNHDLTDLALVHSKSKIKLRFTKSIDHEIDHLKVAEKFFTLKEYGIYNIKGSYKTGNKQKYLDYPIYSLDTTEFRSLLNNVSIVNNSIITTQGIPKNEEYCFYLDASKVEYLENGISYNMSDFATKGNIKSQLLKCHQTTNIPIDLAVESCGSGYYRVIVPPLSEGIYSVSSSYSSYPLRESKMIFNVKPLPEVMTIKPIDASSLTAETIIPFFINVGGLKDRKISVVVSGTAQADTAIGEIDKYNTFLYIYPHSSGFFKIELKDENDEVIIKPLEFEVGESNKLIKENDPVFGARPKAFCSYEKKSSLTVLANTPSMLGTVPDIDGKSLTGKLNVASMDAKNISPLVFYNSTNCEATFKLISPENGLHLINVSSNNCSLPLVPIPIYIDAIPKISGCKEETFYYLSSDNSQTCVISYYPIEKKEFEISVPVEKATFAEKSCAKFQILPQNFGKHVLRVIIGDKETQFQFNVQDPSTDKAINLDEVNIAGKNDLQANEILPGVSYPLIIDTDKYENRVLDNVGHEVYGLCENLRENEPPINLIGISLGEGMYQINVEVPKCSDYKLDFYYANQIVPGATIRFTAKANANSSLKVIKKDDEKFFERNPCRIIIDGRSSKSKIKSVSMKDGSPLSYIVTKTFPKVYVCTFYCESAGPKVLLIESTDNNVIEYNCKLNPRDSSMPELPLPLGMAPIIGTKWKFNEMSQRIYMDNNSLHVLEKRIKPKNSFFAKLYSANSKESTQTEAILTKSKSFKGYITPSSTGLHVLVIGKKKSKTEYWNYYPIPFISYQVLTASCGLPLTIDVAFANIKEVEFVYQNNIEKKIQLTNLTDYFNVKRAKIDFVPKSSGEYSIRIYSAKKNFIEFPLKIHPTSLIQERMNLIRVMGIDYLDKYEIEVGSKHIIMIDARAMEYESDGNLSIIKDESGFKNISGYLKDKSENKTPIIFKEISDGIYSSEILFDKEADWKLSLFYAWNPIFSEPKQIRVKNSPIPTINIVYLSSKEFLAHEPFYLIVHSSKKKNIRAFIKKDEMKNSTIVISPIMNNYLFVGVLINKPGEHTICVEYIDNSKVKEEYLLVVKDNLSLESENTYDFGAVPRVNSLHRMLTQPKIFISSEWPEVFLPIPKNNTLACQLMDSRSLINSIENPINKGEKGVKYYVVPKNEGINAISLKCSLNSIPITFLPTFFAVKPQPVIFQSIPARFIIKQKLLLTNKMSVFYQDSEKKPEYSLRTPSSFIKENIKGYKVYVKCANVGNFILNVPKLTGKTRFFAFKVEISTHPIKQVSMLNFTPNQALEAKQAEYRTFDCTGLSESEISSLKLNLEKISDGAIISETSISNPVISNGYASFQIPIEFSNGIYEATVTSNMFDVSAEPFSIKIDDTLKYHADFLIPKDRIYTEENPAEFLVYTPASVESKINFDITGPMKCLCWNHPVLPNLSYCSFLPMDNGIYTISVLVDGIKLSDQDVKINVVKMSKGMARRPLPFLYAPYSNNKFTTTMTACTFSSLEENKYKKNIKIFPNDKIECQLVDVNSGNIVLVEVLEQSSSEFKISFTSPYHGLHQLTGKIIKPDGTNLELLPIPIVVEDNTHKIGVENKFAISTKGKPKSCNINIISDSNIPFTLTKKIKEKKYNELYSLKGYYVPSFIGLTDILYNTSEKEPLQPIKFTNENFKPEDLVATQGQLFVKQLPIPTNLEISSKNLSLELKDPSNKTSKIKYEVDSLKENLIVSFKPKKSGIYHLKAKYNDINLGQSPFRIYSKVNPAVSSKTKSLINVKIKTKFPAAVKFILVKPDGTEENVIGYSICSSSSDGQEHSLALACNFPEPGVYLIKSTIDSVPINVEPSFVVAEKKSPEICKIDALNEIRVPKKLLINPASGTIKVKAKIIDKYTILLKISMTINILPLETSEKDVILQVKPQSSGLYVIEPKTENHKPIFCEPISFYTEPIQYNVADISSENNSLSGPNKDIFFILEDFPVFKSAAKCEIDGMGVELTDKNKKVIYTNIIKSNENKLGFILKDTILNGKYTMSLLNKGQPMLGSPLKLNAIVPDSFGNISSFAISKNRKLTPNLYKNESSLPLNIEKSVDNRLVISCKVDEYGVYHFNLSDANANIIKVKYIIVVPPIIVDINKPLILKRPAMIEDMSNITVMVKNPLGVELEAPVKLLFNNLILINAKLNIPGTYNIAMYDADGKIISSELTAFTYSIDENAIYKTDEPVKVNEKILLYFPILPNLINKSDEDIMRNHSLVNCIVTNNIDDFEAKIAQIDRKKNLITVSVSPSVCGLHYISLIDFTSTVPSISQASSIIAFSKYNVEANKVIAHGDGLTSSVLYQESRFEVDMTNVPKKNLTVKSDFENVVFKMEDCSDSKVKYTYIPDTMGDMFISILYDEEHILGSPFKVNVSDSRIFNLDSPIYFVPMKTMYFYISKNMNDKTKSIGIELTGPNKNLIVCSHEVCKPIHGYPGSKICVKFYPTIHGIHVARFINKKHNKTIKDGIRNFYIGPWGYVPKDQFMLLGQGLKSATVGEDNHFIILSKSDVKYSSFLINVHGPTKCEFNMKCVEKDRVMVTYNPTEEGDYELELKYDDEDINGTPIKVKAVNPIKYAPYKEDISTIYVQGEGIKKATVGTFNVFSIFSNVAKSQKIKVKITHSGKEVYFNRSDMKGKVQNVANIGYSPLEAGIYEIAILSGENHINGSPFNIYVEKMNSNPSLVKTFGIENISGKILSPTEFIIDASEGEDGALDVQIYSQNNRIVVQPTVVRLGGKIYLVKIKFDTPTEYLISITWDGIDIPSSPFKV